MIKRITISTFCFLFFLVGTSQSQEALEIRMWSDQRVLIVGEPLWFEGYMNNAAFGGKSIVIRLIDRNGQSRSETEIVPDQTRLSGYIGVPDVLPSDYYFIDASVKGQKTKTFVAPVMVINPRFPASPECKVPETTPALTNTLRVSTSKSLVQPRGAVTIETEAMTLNQISVSAVRYDQLDETIESASAGSSLVVVHDAMGVPETEGAVIVAQALVNGSPAKGIRLMAAIKKKKSAIATSTTNEYGMATFILPMIYEQGAVLISPVSEADKNAVITVELPSSQPYPLAFPCLQLNESHRKDIETRMFNSSVSARFFGNRLINVEVPERDTSDFYGKPDVLFMLDDYVRFPNMEEVISEIIPQMRVKKIANGQIIQVLNQPTKAYFEDQPLILVDGTPVNNSKAILESDPLLIRSIEIVSRKYLQGTTEFNGIVHFRSYKGDMAGLSPVTNASFPFQGVQEYATYNSADHSKKTDRMPDMRNLLLREVGLNGDQIKNGVRFFAPDSEGKYRITLKGINQRGEWLYGTTIIEVKAN
jgi:hypothetical protein